MKMTYGFLSRSQLDPFDLALNTILAYEYEYSGRIRKKNFPVITYKLKINK